MPLHRFKTVKTDDITLTKIQDNISDAYDPLITNIALNSTILTEVILVAGQVNKIPHTLGRNLSGWQVIRKRAAADIYDTQDINLSPNLLLYLWTTANVTVDLLVF